MWVLISPSWPCVQAEADSNEPSNSALTALASSFTSSGKPLHVRYWRRRMKWWAWARRFCGRTCARSMDDLGAAAWIVSRPDTPVNRSAWRVGDVLSAMSDTCGLRFVESLRKSARRSVSSRTLQGTLLSDSETFEPTWNDWVTWWRRDCLRRRKSARRTAGNGCSSWPTMRKADGRGVTYQYDDHSNKEKPRKTLCGVARLWPTARGEDGECSGNHPNAQDSLTGTAALWPTQTGEFSHSSRPAPTTATPGEPSSPSAPTSPRRLNPAFVEWLMGWPVGLTAFGCSATALCRWKAPMRSQLSWLVLRQE